MSGRRPGPPPKDPEDRVRRNDDPVVGADGWVEIDPTPNDDAPPAIPEWVGEISEAARIIYRELATLPQARLWGAGTWLQLHMSLPMFDKYMEKPGGDGLRTLVNIWGVSLRLTEDDMQKARIKMKRELDEEAEVTGPAGVNNVVSLAERRNALVAGRAA